MEHARVSGLPPGATPDALCARGLELACVAWPGSGTPIVLLHGLGGNALWWSGLAAGLPGRQRLAVDLPGHGESAPIGTWEIAAIAEWLAAACAERFPEGVIWVGHSWGGKLAVAAAGAMANTRGLVLVDASPVARFAVPDPAAAADDLFACEYGPWPSLEAAHEVVRLLPQYTPWSDDLEAAFARGVRADGAGGVDALLSREKAAAIIARAFEVDLTDAASSLETPVLNVRAADVDWGDWDPNRAALPRASHVRLPGNHWLPTNDRDRLVGVVAAWIEEQGL